MKIKLDYIFEQLYGAVSCLISGDITARERLVDSVVSRLHRVFLSESNNELSTEISDRLSRLHEKLTKKGSFQETIEAMEDVEVQASIDEIFSIYTTVARNYPE